jgi:hypothetical protein
VGVWLHGCVLRPSDCPLCRRPITLLVPSEVASLLRDEPEIAPVLNRIEQYNGRFGGAPHSMIQVNLPYLLSATAIWVTHSKGLSALCYICTRFCSWLLLSSEVRLLKYFAMKCYVTSEKRTNIQSCSILYLFDELLVIDLHQTVEVVLG